MLLISPEKLGNVEVPLCRVPLVTPVTPVQSDTPPHPTPGGGRRIPTFPTLCFLNQGRDGMLLTSALHSWEAGGQLGGVGTALEFKGLNKKKSSN